jgi:hypothetical protein
MRKTEKIKNFKDLSFSEMFLGWQAKKYISTGVSHVTLTKE